MNPPVIVKLRVRWSAVLGSVLTVANDSGNLSRSDGRFCDRYLELVIVDGWFVNQETGEILEVESE